MTHARLTADNFVFFGDGSTEILDMSDYDSATFVMESANTDNVLTIQQSDNDDMSNPETFNDGINDASVTGVASGEMMVIEARHPGKRYVRATASGTGVGVPVVMATPRNLPAVTTGTVLTVSN